MWNLFRRKSSKDKFPKPEWPPIQDFDSVDLTGQRKDGGVDLVIVASQPLDDSPSVLSSIRQKVAAYLAVIQLDEFQSEMNYPPRDLTNIVIVCKHPVHPAANVVIEQCQALAAEQGVRLELKSTWP